MLNLTDLAIRSLKAPDKGQKDYFDGAMPGFSVRISQGGTRSFFFFSPATRKTAFTWNKRADRRGDRRALQRCAINYLQSSLMKREKLLGLPDPEWPSRQEAAGCDPVPPCRPRRCPSKVLSRDGDAR
jgi:hypothetical protein